MRMLRSMSGYGPSSPWLSSRGRADPFLREQLCEVRPNRLPPRARRKAQHWAASRRTGSAVGDRWVGTQQPTCLNWSGPLGQQVARTRSGQGSPASALSCMFQGPQLPGLGVARPWAGRGPLCLCLSPFYSPNQARRPFSAAPLFQSSEHCPALPPTLPLTVA